jgi:hypothetical protein
MLPALSAGNGLFILINCELYCPLGGRKVMSTGFQHAQKANIFLFIGIKHQFQLNELVQTCKVHTIL